MKVVLYPHGGSGNHGCEALVRSTAYITQAELSLFTSSLSEDHRYGLQNICYLYRDIEPCRRFSKEYVKASILYYLLGCKNAFDLAAYRHFFEISKKSDYALSIGGDNYCYGEPMLIYLLNKRLRELNVSSILWGCSIEPCALSSSMLDDLGNYKHIIARETITYNALYRKGIRNISLYPDPAFQLRRVPTKIPDGFQEKNTVGINISPMVIGCEKIKGITYSNYISLINYILEKTDMNVALIPHVVWEKNDDRGPLQELKNFFKESDRIVFIEDRPAEELKDIIARCRFMIAARTHASIAAYSEHVPTLVIEYSVKARGIATDIFGSDEHYVIPVQELNKSDALISAAKWLFSHENHILSHYRSIMPEYKGKVVNMLNILS